jgi:hypothetical protein
VRSSGASAETGTVQSLAVARDGDGRYFGWASIQLAQDDSSVLGAAQGATGILYPFQGALLRLRGDGGWGRWGRDDASADYGAVESRRKLEGGLPAGEVAMAQGRGGKPTALFVPLRSRSDTDSMRASSGGWRS